VPKLYSTAMNICKTPSRGCEAS